MKETEWTAVNIIAGIWAIGALIMWILACFSQDQFGLVEVPDTVKYIIVALVVGKTSVQLAEVIKK